MKKALLVLFFAGLAGSLLSAWEPSDLTRFPACTKAGDLIFNAGLGFDYPGPLGGDYIYILPIRATFDYNIAIGDNKLPFFAGGILGYSGYGYRDEWFFSRISVGGRFGYHFNWGVDKLDTYAVGTAGWMIYAGEGMASQYQGGWPLYGINVGARYFITDWFGFWAELGFTSLSFADIGITLKF
jgi:hypothetical protein